MDPMLMDVSFPAPDAFSPSELYHENSKLFPVMGSQFGARIQQFFDNAALQRAASQSHKVYPTSPHIPLPAARPIDISITDALKQRQSVRDYAANAVIPLDVLGAWLGWGCGILTRATGEQRRTYPSAGALYPLETYLVVRRADGLQPGIYHYNVVQHSLEAVADAAAAERTVAGLVQEDASRGCHVAVLLSAVFLRTRIKYGERGYRFVLLEAGHLMQNLSLLALDLGIGMTSLGGFYDDQLHQELGINGVDEAVVHVATAGPISR
jgi:SagB-type dehydrogenase family enzyme